MLRRSARSLWKAWMTFAHALGRVNTVIILTVFYVVILAPYGIASALARLFAKKSTPAWILREPDEPTLESLRRPF